MVSATSRAANRTLIAACYEGDRLRGFFFKQKTAYEIQVCLEFRRVLFRSRRAIGEPVPIGGPPARHVSTARPKTRRDRKTHRKTPPASSLRSPAADFVRLAGCTALLHPFFPDTLLAP